MPAANTRQLHGEGGGGSDTVNQRPRQRAYVGRLYQALVADLDSATRNNDIFLMNLIGGALGAFAKARVFESLDENTSSEEEPEVGLLLCEAVYLFSRSCTELRRTDPVAIMIWNKARGEELAKVVIDRGLGYLVNPNPLSFGMRHPRQTPHLFFHSQLKEALKKAQIELQGDIRAEVASLL